ncbi:MAG: NAD-glutamate dehydrogenase [Brevundimonas sp.]|uniref:NAD-glutamate dehydrogenase n=1 Tax=Brevundimonas sp. TaxID=1871086 RepID=UPI00391C5018
MNRPCAKASWANDRDGYQGMKHDQQGVKLSEIEKTFSAAVHGARGRRLDDIQRDFLAQAVEDYEDDETPELSPVDFAQALGAFWIYGKEAKAPRKPRIRVRELKSGEGASLDYDAIEIVQKDAPFLVDSVMGELADAGVYVRAMFHPVVTQEDGARVSMIMVVVDSLPEDRRSSISDALASALEDVHAAVADFPAMTRAMDATIAELQSRAPGVEPEVLHENLAFLQWLNADQFVFLGMRRYEYPRKKGGGYEANAPLVLAGEGLGVLRDPERAVLRRTNEPAVMTTQMKRQIGHSEPVTVAKANLRSRVHRRAYMDYVGVKSYGEDGSPIGETRFVGLFTAEAYDRPAADVPLVRRKVAQALARAGKSPGSHSYKRLKNILENYPRDELFQMDEEQLLSTALGILHLFDRPRVKMFARKDPFDRFISALVFIPREKFDAGVRERIGRHLARAYGGRLSAWYPQLGDAPLVRIHYIIGVNPGDHLDPDPVELEQQVVDISRTWVERFETAARRAGVAEAGISALSSKWAETFPAGYRDRYSAAEAVRDLNEVDPLASDGADGAVAVRAFRNDDDSALRFRFKLYRRGGAAPLSDVLPILADMGLTTLEEFGHTLKPPGDTPVHIQEFLLEDPRGESLSFDDVRHAFQDAFKAVWRGHTESDGFNRLVLELGVGWRDAALVRTLARYRQQTGLDPSQGVQQEALQEHADVARDLLALFYAKFDPDHGEDTARREGEVARLCESIEKGLQEVSSLDHDRVLRRLYQLVLAIKRTNYFQKDAEGRRHPHISIKIASREIEDLPLPKPYREIFVWAPHVEGVHLRFGPVARGGLRWSDRREDFRTEVLGLVKAQQVKNAVIVPVGSKGGFYAKALPRGGAPEAIREEGIRAYRTFLSGLLDITDNLDASGEVVRPQGVIAWEDDDPYLVVAADKGTATFSDIANAVSEAYGFWLGDAFASGGSAGYDHKVMGITARGAWEAVKRHFREMGKDIQSEDFTVVGVGDMSGDVFGNGMLLSKHIRLVAAFDHRDIFVDPDPDAARSWKERKRMFDLPRSSWQDYDKSLISKGGGVFSRSQKAITISPEMREALGIEDEKLDPPALIRAILRAPAELLYLGGIGTYVKEARESNLQVGDKANDAVRVDAEELRCKVVGEGANLGLTQAGRIAFARHGGRINTDAIDNSAGVDSSDHEVNIKILTGSAESDGKLDRKARNKLLASMTDEVAEKVLAHNYDQTLAISLQEARAAADLDAHARFMDALERQGKLDRGVEGLPGLARVQEMAAAGLGLSRPELSVITAYAKIELFDDIVASRAPEDEAFWSTLKSYFPAPLSRFEDQMREHRLRREIIATVLANTIINRTGATFPERLRVSAECDTTAMVLAFEAARRVFRLNEAWDDISAQDGKIPAEAQTALYNEVSTVLRRQTLWLARRASRHDNPSVGALVDSYRPAADALTDKGASLLSHIERDSFEQRQARFIELGAPEALAARIALLRSLTSTPDIGDLAEETGMAVPSVARLYHHVGAELEFDRLKAAAASVASQDHYERLAVRRMVEDMMQEQVLLTRAIASEAGDSVTNDKTAHKAVCAWIEPRLRSVERVRRAIDDIDRSGQGWSFAKLTVANVALRELALAGE